MTKASEFLKNTYECNGTPKEEELLGRKNPFFAKCREIADKKIQELEVCFGKTEDYKYMRPKAVPRLEQKWELPQKTDTKLIEECIFECDIPNLKGHTIFTLNGQYYTDQGQLITKLPNGIIYGSLQEASVQFPQLVEKHYNKLAEKSNDELVLLNTKHAFEGIFIYVPKGVQEKTPIQVVFLLESKNPLLVNFRNLIIMEEQSELSIVFCDHSLAPTDSFSQLVSEYFIAQQAHLDLILLQSQHNESMQVHHVFVDQQRDSVCDSGVFVLHGGVMRNNFSFDLRGENAHAHCNGLALIDEDQYVDMHTIINHIAPHCESNQLYKSIVDQEGEGNFYGIIHVHRDAQKTEAYQRNANILLTDRAQVHTRPQLLIDADDVKCSHGATTGQLDDDAKFYMLQRGIPMDEVNRLLMSGFANDVLRTLPLDSCKTHLEELINKRLRGEVSKCYEGAPCVIHEG